MIRVLIENCTLFTLLFVLLYSLNFSVESSLFVDVGLVAKRAMGKFEGLGGLTQTVLGVDLLKSKDISMSDWSSRRFTLTQIRYAAWDAMSSYEIYEKLRSSYPFQSDSLKSTQWISDFLDDSEISLPHDFHVPATSSPTAPSSSGSLAVTWRMLPSKKKLQQLRRLATER